MAKLSAKEQLLLNEIIGLIDGFDDQTHAIAALLELTIAIGCKYQERYNGEAKRCAGCPLTSYICRDIYDHANRLMEEDEDGNKCE
jgi:hypothetical protein